MLQRLDLSGTWRARWSDGQRGRPEYANRDETDACRYIDAAVPGEIHLDLIRAGLIDEPAVGTNCLAARWVEECIWSYRREFTVSAATRQAKHVWLNFERLDLAATVVLNGETVGTHKNSFHPCRLDVTGKLRAGRNILAVHVEGGLFDAAEKPIDGYGVAKDAWLHKRVWLRKPQCQFSWDWSTRLVNVGITGGVQLEWTDEPFRVDQFVPLASLSEDLVTGRVQARLFVEGLGEQEQPGELTVRVVEAGVKVRQTVTIRPGQQACEAVVTVLQPELWWPVGQGRPVRYTVEATLRVAGRLAVRRRARVGFRYVRFNQDPHPAGGRHFRLEVNGRPIFAKGGNFVPADLIFARIDRARYDRLTDLALEANFNILRIWGGGLYESDDFYDLCDAKGILVWQEFIFACGKFPAYDREFLASVQAEARYNVRRLAGHPSLVAWCGNNEMEWGAWSWGYDRAGMASTDYHLFHLVLPRLLREEDPDRYYQPSSPFSPDGVEPNANDRGDQHPWSIGFQDTDFRKYRQMSCRFPNEGGILGPCALPTVMACLPPGQQQVQSFAWQVHDNSVDSWAEPSPPDGMLTQWLGKDIRSLTIPEYVYWAGLLQGEGLREYCDNFRRRMFDNAAAIFWMYNDTWPAVRSWTVVDYYLRRTPAFHAVRRALQPVHVVLAEEAGEVCVYGINDTAAAVAAELTYGVLALAGAYPLRQQMTVCLAANSATRLAAFPSSAWRQRGASMAFATLERDGRLLARNRLFEPLFKEITWPKPRIRVTVANGEAVFQSPTFAWGVCLDLDGDESLPDNFFDLFPGQPYRLPWLRRQPPKILFVWNLEVSNRTGKGIQRGK